VPRIVQNFPATVLSGRCLSRLPLVTNRPASCFRHLPDQRRNRLFRTALMGGSGGHHHRFAASLTSRHPRLREFANPNRTPVPLQTKRLETGAPASFASNIPRGAHSGLAAEQSHGSGDFRILLAEIPPLSIAH